MMQEQKITPSLWFDFQAEEAVAHYLSIFADARVETVSRYSEGEHAGKAMSVLFSIEGQRFLAINGGPHFKFTPALSLMVNCKSQAEIDHLWERLSEGGAKSRCGWLTDRYGLSWQIVPAALEQIMQSGDKERAARVMKKLMTMDKLIISDLERA
jgi:predicted 3-demethylubiquinone-9 3-methyltransferase (glyoxalase superfamily)